MPSGFRDKLLAVVPKSLIRELLSIVFSVAGLISVE